MTMRPFHLLFPELAERECRTIRPMNHERLPSRRFLFLESYCVEPRCDCRRVMLSVVEEGIRAQVATINHAFEPPGPPNEVERTCDHVTIVDRGRIVASGTPDALAGGGERIEVTLATEAIPAGRAALEAAGFRVSRSPNPGGLWVEGAPDGASVSRVLAAVGCYPDELIRRRDSLEDVFLRLTGSQDESTP